MRSARCAFDLFCQSPSLLVHVRAASPPFCYVQARLQCAHSSTVVATLRDAIVSLFVALQLHFVHGARYEIEQPKRKLPLPPHQRLSVDGANSPAAIRRRQTSSPRGGDRDDHVVAVEVQERLKDKAFAETMWQTLSQVPAASIDKDRVDFDKFYE